MNGLEQIRIYVFNPRYSTTC